MRRTISVPPRRLSGVDRLILTMIVAVPATLVTVLNFLSLLHQ